MRGSQRGEVLGIVLQVEASDVEEEVWAKRVSVRGFGGRGGRTYELALWPVRASWMKREGVSFAAFEGWGVGGEGIFAEVDLLGGVGLAGLGPFGGVLW